MRTTEARQLKLWSEATPDELRQHLDMLRAQRDKLTHNIAVYERILVDIEPHDHAATVGEALRLAGIDPENTRSRRLTPQPLRTPPLLASTATNP